MGLLAPGFLLGLLAVGLPVYFHLLRQHRSTPQPFSSLMFLEPAPQSSIRHRRLRYWLLLALRATWVALLALAFAGPYWLREAPASGGRPGLTVIVLDHSFSMRAAGRLEEARKQAVELLHRLPPGSRVQVAELGSSIGFLTEPTSDRSQLETAIGSVRPSDEASSFGELVRALRLLREREATVELHFFSDLQRTSAPASIADLEPPPGTAIVAHRVGPAEAPNFAVESVETPGTVFGARPVVVKSTVGGFGAGSAERKLSLYCGGKLIASQAVQVPGNGRVTVEFPKLELAHGFNRCELRLDRGDPLAEDDRFRFVIERADPFPMLFVDRARDSRARLYFQAALEAAGSSAFQLQAATAPETANLDPQAYRLIVLSDPGELPGGFLAKLERYVRQGGALWILAGPRMARQAQIPVLNARVEGTEYYAGERELFQLPGLLDENHPSVRATNRWAGVRFFHVTRVEPGDAQVIARLADETPVLFEKRLGEGRVLVFGSTLDNVANDFPLHAAFVPFVAQTADYLAGIERRAATLAVGSYLQLRATSSGASVVALRGLEGESLLGLEEAARAQTFRLEREGFYELRRGSGRVEVVAVNADRRESDLRPLEEEWLVRWRGSEGQQAGQIAAGAGQREQVPLWWWVLLVALGVAVAEALVSRRYLAIERGAA